MFGPLDIKDDRNFVGRSENFPGKHLKKDGSRFRIKKVVVG